MSFVSTLPDLVATASDSLAGLGSTLQAATAAAAGPTGAVAAAASDEISTAISELFGSFGQEFQAVNTQAAAFHAEFVRLLNSSSAAYLSAEIANAEQTLAGAVSAPFQSLLAGGTAATVPGGAYAQLFTNTATNLQSLGSGFAANPFPFLRQFLANQQGYAQQIAAAIANFPANLPNLPAAIEAAIQQALAFNPAAFFQQFIAVQTGFAQTFVTSAISGFSGLVTGLPNFANGLGVAAQSLLAGNFTGAVSDFGRAALGLLVTGIDPGNVHIVGGLDVPTLSINLTATLNPELIGPLGDLFTIMNIPGQEAQYFTNLIPPSIPRQIAQNFTDVINTLTVPSISAVATLDGHLAPPAVDASLSTFFGLPLVATYAAAGAPLATLNAIATSAETFGQALATGNYLGAAGTLFDAPAAALNGFLNGSAPIDTTINVPIPDLGDVGIVLHLPSDGLLVPPHPVTATINIPNLNPIDLNILGTPFSGLIPLLVNYAPQQLALAITPS